MPEPWRPPFHLHLAGRGESRDASYWNDVSVDPGPRRILIKHTLSGTGTLYVHERRFRLPVGTMFVIERPGPYVYCYEEQGEPWCFEYISISFTNPRGLLPPHLRRNPVMSLTGHDDLREQLRQLIDLRADQGYRESLMHSAQGYRLFLSYIAARSPEFIPPPSSPAQLMRNILDRRFNESIAIGDCARETGYTVEAVTRAFTRAYGVSPVKYLKALRVRRACELLAAGHLSLKEIAGDVGFTDANYFGRVFRQLTGRTPGQYRRNPDPLLPSALMG